MTAVARAYAAALTPLADGGSRLDEDAFGPYMEFLAAGGVDGILALGTTGEGLLLTVDERKRALGLFLEAASGRLEVLAHCGAQSTADTVALAADAAERGAAGVAVIAPPYFPLDPEEQVAHLTAAARACDPCPFYVYEFAARSGYRVAPETVLRVRDAAPNVVGMKVSDAPWEALEPYLALNLDVYVGAEELVVRALAAGAAGAVSALAAAFPEAVAETVAEPTEARDARLGAARDAVSRFPFHAGLKEVVRARGVPLRSDVRPPLRTLTDAERTELLAWLESSPAQAR